MASRPLESTPLHAQQQQAAAGSSGAKRKKVVGEKRKRPMEDSASRSPRLVDPSSFLATPRAVARVEEG